MSNYFILSLSITEIFISSIIIFALYFLFFTKKLFFRKDKYLVISFSVILFLFLQHIIFEIFDYFAGFNKIIFYRTLVNFFLIPLFYAFLFYFKKYFEKISWYTLFVFYAFATSFSLVEIYFNLELIQILLVFFKMGTAISLYYLILNYFFKNH